MITLMTLDPGHFHAALLQKTMVEQISPTVYVFAPGGDDLEAHLRYLEHFNSRPEHPTAWRPQVYEGADFLQQMLRQRPGEVVLIAGVNARKTNYIQTAVEAGLHVLADKPLCIDTPSWETLQTSLDSAATRGVLLSDIMTSRHEITHIVLRALVNDAEVFGVLERGSPERPAIVKQSTHHLFKAVDGRPLIRPAWYFDVTQQGEGIVDVTTHLVDQVMWTCFPEQRIDYAADIDMQHARRWPTRMSRDQFKQVTGLSNFPATLQQALDRDGNLPYSCNGDMLFTIKGIHTQITVQWDYQAPPGGGDTHTAATHGTRSIMRIRQGAAQGFQPQLYVEPAAGVSNVALGTALATAVRRLQSPYPGIAATCEGNEWRIVIPDVYRMGHEAHFAEVLKTYLRHLERGAPDWAAPNLLAKYYITTQALALARKT
jgi:predicted dehydrogenase